MDTGGLNGSAQVSVTVNFVNARVSASSDDAEERASGSVSLTSSDLELVFDSGGNQTVGMRFNGLVIPPGATITNAYVQFETDETTSDATSLTIQGEDVDTAATFVGTSGNVSSRPITSASVAWSPPAWPTKDAAGPDQRTPDISSVIQEIVNRSGWMSGNSLVIVITGSGERTAESFDGEPPNAPLLHVEFQTSGRPIVIAAGDPTVTLPDVANLTGTVPDDGLPDPPGAVTTTWSQVDGPGTVTFASPSALDTTASFSETGTYVLRLTADDGEFVGSDDRGDRGGRRNDDRGRGTSFHKVR